MPAKNANPAKDVIWSSDRARSLDLTMRDSRDIETSVFESCNSPKNGLPSFNGHWS